MIVPGAQRLPYDVEFPRVRWNIGMCFWNAQEKGEFPGKIFGLSIFASVGASEGAVSIHLMAAVHAASGGTRSIDVFSSLVALRGVAGVVKCKR